MRYASVVNRLINDGARAWEIHDRALAYQATGRDVIVLSIGDPEFSTPQPIVRSLVEQVETGNTHYGAIDGGAELKETIARWHSRHYGVNVTPDQVSVTLGAQGALYGAAMCTFERGDEVIVPQPVYVTYDSVVQSTGASRVDVALRPERGFHLDPADIAGAVTPRTRAIMINTPHNPTGAVYRRQELEELADICMANDLWLISDEVYNKTIFDERSHLSPSTIPGMAERTIVINSLSKSHAMTGWRVGWTIGPPEFTAHMYNLGLALHYGPPTFVQDAVICAFAQDLPDVDRFRREFEGRRDLVCDSLAHVPNISVLRPEGTCFMLIDIRATGLSSGDFADRLLEEANVALLSAEAFGTAGAGFVRLSLTAKDAVLQEATRRIAKFGRDIDPG